MLKIKLILILSFITITSIYAQDFILELPDTDFQYALIPEKFPNTDAVIVAKEQSILVSETVSGVESYTVGYSTTYSKAIIVKLFNEKAVDKFGSFSYEYYDRTGMVNKYEFMVAVRVLKPNGEVIIMDDNEIIRTVKASSKYFQGKDIIVSFKVPNLAVNDILQIEYTHADPNRYATSGFLFYNDEYLTLHSNVHITLPSNNDYEYISIPENIVGQPRIERKVEKRNIGMTYTWTAKNLYPMPDEPFSRPFEDKSCMTAFYIKSLRDERVGNWDYILKDYYKDVVKDDEISDKYIKMLDFYKPTDTVTTKNVEELYTALKKYFKLKNTNSIYPDIEKIGDIFEGKEGDASDIAFIFFKILKKWGVKTDMVFIRDKREGLYDVSIPTLKWFDRLGINVKFGSDEKIYDFDNSLSSVYEKPWYLNNVFLPYLRDDKVEHKKITFLSTGSSNAIKELHYLNLNEGKYQDSLQILLNGANAQVFRENYYENGENEGIENIKNEIKKWSFKEINSYNINDIKNNDKIKVTIKGESASNFEQIDTYYNITLKNHYLSKLKNSFNTETRYDDIILYSPVEYAIEYQIKVPDNSVLQQIENNKIMGPAKSDFRISRTLDGNILKVKASLYFPDVYIPKEKYKELKTFLDASQNELEKSIVLKK